MDKQQLETLCDEISMSLNHQARFVGMQGEYSDHDAHFETPNGAQFYIRFDSHTKRLTVNGLYNGLWKFRNQYHNPAPTITVSPDRTPAKIAQDIGHRFLPVFLEDWSKAQCAKAAHLAACDLTASNAARLVNASGGMLEISRNNSDGDGQRIRLYGHGQIDGVEVSEDRAEITLRLPIETAVKVLELLATMEPAKKELNSEDDLTDDQIATACSY